MKDGYALGWKWRLANGLCPRDKRAENVLHLAQFWYAHGRRPEDRASFNDALFHIKTSPLIDTPLRRFVSDKEHVKVFVAGTVGDEYNVPTVAVLRDRNEVFGYDYAAGTIAKPTHSSGRAVVIDRDGEVDRERVAGWLEDDYYAITRTRNYKNLERKVIVEPLVFGTRGPLDYKFHCFRGRVQLIHVDFDREIGHKRAFFTRDFERLPFSVGYPIAPNPLERPENLDEMIEVAEALAAPFSFIRVDLYSNGDQIRVGEITNVHGNAHEKFIPSESEAEYGPAFFDHARGPLSELLRS